MKNPAAKIQGLILTLIALFVVSTFADAMMTGGGSVTAGSGENTGITGGKGPMGMMSTMPMPTTQMMYTFGAINEPVLGSDPSTSMPIGVGSIAEGGNMMTIHTEVGQFQMPMDMYLAVFDPSVDPFNVYVMNPQGELQPTSMGLTPWMAGVTSMDQMPFGTDISTTGLPKGTYYIGLMTTPSGGDMSAYYFWTTSFTIQ